MALCKRNRQAIEHTQAPIEFERTLQKGEVWLHELLAELSDIL